MARISPEEKRKEAGDWFKGLIGIVLVLGVLLVGYLIYQGVKDNLALRETQQKAQQEDAGTKPSAQEPVSWFIAKMYQSNKNYKE